jgi:hypothetical protein
MKFKFKITETTTIDDAEKELDSLCSVPVNEIPFNHILKIAEFLGVEHMKANGGSMERFHHPLAETETYGGHFGVHIVHKGKAEVLVMRTNYKKYMYPILKKIIEKKRTSKI